MYFFQANCKSENINVFFSNKFTLSKSTVALAVVGIDLFIAFFFYMSLLYLRSIQKKTAAEINESVLKPSDFSVQIKNLPKITNLRLLKMKLWSFIESVLEKENYFLRDRDIKDN